MIASATIAKRIKTLRIARGLGRKELATMLHVDVTAIAAWENGHYLPRDRHKAGLASLLGIAVDDLFYSTKSEDPENPPEPIKAVTVDTMEELSPLLVGLLTQTKQSVRALRLAAPYSTPAHVQKEFRLKIRDRLLSDSLEVQRAEIFYTLDRLKEVLCNIIAYDGRRYWVKAYCANISDVVPGMGAYFFDSREFLIGAYWSGIPPHNRPGLLLSGEPFAIYFDAYWDEIWRRGTLLNNRGAHDFTEIRKLAISMGLDEDDWPIFLEEARTLDIGDRAPPLI